jgi:hypothetical protein
MRLDGTGSVVFCNDTISNNTAGTNGGGIYIDNGGETAVTNQTFLVNLTVASNHSNTTADGGGIFLNAGFASLGNSIIVYNTSGATADDLKGTTFDFTFGGVTPLGAPNIASSLTSVGGSNFASDPFNIYGNPLLGFLQINPPSAYTPPTATRAISITSLAAFKGSVDLDNAFANFTALLDQRGLNRQAPHPGKVDLGAYD